MFRRTKVCTGVLIAVGGTLAIGTAPVFGQQQLERVEITGSAIRRIDAESALPVQVIRKEDIARSGATSTVDLLQKLSSIQNSTNEASAVGGSTAGFSGVSIHGIGEQRTLVLLNGRRLAQFGGQTLTGFGAGMDLNAIPVSAIERVEILTDGASAFYGADAIAGVVNFITKRDTTDGDITAGFSKPKAGAEEKRISFTKGFGSLAQNGFNVIVTASHDERTQLNATDRDFAKSGKVFFSDKGKNYRFQQFSPSPIPANALDDQGQLISPYLLTNGVCPPKTFRVTEPYNDGSGLVDDYCGFDFVGELEIYPERKRDSLMVSGGAKLGEHELFADLLWSRTTQVSRIAPVPGGISIPAGSALHTQYLLPLGITGNSTAFYRIADLGKRTNDDEAKFLEFALGSKGLLAGWDYNTHYSHSQSDVKQNISGYPGALGIRRLRASGALDPFVLEGQQSVAGLAALNAANYKGYWDGGTAKLDTLAVRGSRELTALPAGPLMLAAGANFNLEKFASKPSLFAQGRLADPVAGTLCDPLAPSGDPLECDQRFGDGAASPPYSADRKSYGVFGELLIPVFKNFEVGTALRYDHYSDFGNATTAKLNFRWTPEKSVLVRGSVGTGFHAPTVPQVAASRRAYGVTEDNYTCTAELAAVAAAQGAVCQPGNRQYDQIAGGNADLKPEKSLQGTLGIRIEPNSQLSMGVDLWHVGIKDQFGQLTEQEVFANPQKYSTSWGSTVDIGTGTNYLAFVADNKNLGKYYATGLDFDVVGRVKTGVGELTSQVVTTYMIREDQQLLADGPYYSAIGNNNPNLGFVTFRWQGRWTNTLKTDKWAHTLGVNFKSGYTDVEQDADLLDASGNVVGQETVQLQIKRFATLDWQTQYNPFKSFSVTFGVLNVFDTAPPLSLKTAGGGQQFGYDDRYYDPRGRTYYLNASYKF
ncbi:MAG: TonB-dependent receptor [Rhizobacter sp.]|nr:TonB-dependent receptor [Rhizobacter sp.]